MADKVSCRSIGRTIYGGSWTRPDRAPHGERVLVAGKSRQVLLKALRRPSAAALKSHMNDQTLGRVTVRTNSILGINL